MSAVALLAIFGYSRLETANVDRPNLSGDTTVIASTAGTAQQPRLHPTGFFNGWFVSRNVGWTVMSGAMGSATLSRTIDGGIHWMPQLQLAYPHLLERDMSFIDQNNGFVAVGIPTAGQIGSRLMTTNDGGGHWSARSLPAGLVYGLDFISSNIGYTLIHHDTSTAMYRTGDGGITWQACGSLALSDIHPSLVHMEGVRFASGSLGWVAGWMTSPSGSTVAFYRVTDDGCGSWQTAWLAPDSQGSNAVEVMYLDLPELVEGRFASALVTRDRSGGGFQLSVYSSQRGTSLWSLDGQPVSSHTSPAWAPVGHSHSATIVNGTLSESSQPTASFQPGGAFLGVQFVDDIDGFAEVAVGSSPRLMVTHDGGASWALVKEG